MSILIAKNIKKRYKKDLILKNITLKLNSGEIVGLLGPNGAGKTTIFHIIIGIIKHYFGNVYLNNKDITTLPIYLRAREGIGYLPQGNSIFRKLTVFNNILAAAQINNKLNNQQNKIYIHELMNKFNIIHLKNKIGKSLSGGERKKVEIARTLATNPKFILLDEPFSEIDPISITDIKKTIKKLKKKNIGIFITDHNVKETLTICDRVYIIHNGSIIAHGIPIEILNNKKVKLTYLGEGFLI